MRRCCDTLKSKLTKSCMTKFKSCLYLSDTCTCCTIRSIATVFSAPRGTITSANFFVGIQNSSKAGLTVHDLYQTGVQINILNNWLKTNYDTRIYEINSSKDKKKMAFLKNLKQDFFVFENKFINYTVLVY